MAKHNDLGKLGEDITCKYLEKEGFEIWGRNLDYKVSEIDIIAIKNKKVHFLEVKSGQAGSFYTRENMTRHKQHKLHRAIEVHLLKYKDVQNWQIDIAFVHIDFQKRLGRVEMLWDQILEG